VSKFRHNLEAGQGLIQYSLPLVLVLVIATIIYAIVILSGNFQWWCCWLPIALSFVGPFLKWLDKRWQHKTHREKKKSNQP